MNSPVCELYTKALDEVKQTTTEKDLIKLQAAANTKLGPLKRTERNSWNVNLHTSGTFVTVQFKTEFETGSGIKRFVYRNVDRGALPVRSSQLRCANHELK